MKKYEITGMTCNVCREHIEKVVSDIQGVSAVSVSLLTHSMTVEGTEKEADVIRAVEKAGYGAIPLRGNSLLSALTDDREVKGLRRRLLLSLIFLFLLMYLSMGYTMFQLPLPSLMERNYILMAEVQAVLALIVIGCNFAFFRFGIRALLSTVPNMDTLVALGSGVSFLWSLFVLFKMESLGDHGTNIAVLAHLYHHSLYFESAAMIPALITVGKLLEACSKGRTTEALKHLLELSPRTATVIDNGKERVILASAVKRGQIFIVRPGETVPVDGKIIEGQTAIDESMLTGESIPMGKSVGDKVHAASLNQFGTIRAIAEKVGEDTTFAQMVDLVMAVSAGKAPVARLADRVSSVFVPVIIGVSIIVFPVWLFLGESVEMALEHAIAVLVISCPCALGLATPVAVMAGNGMAARQGILFKTGASLEKTGKLTTVILDKTGTITAGKLQVTDICPVDTSSEVEFLRYAYSLEKLSEHPLAVAVVAECEKRHVSDYLLTNFRAAAGYGVEGVRAPFTVHGGSERYIKQFAVIPKVLKDKGDEYGKVGKTVIYFEKSGEVLGIIALADVIKGDSVQAVKELHRLGMNVVMLTGDHESAANEIGRIAGISHVLSEVLPADKEKVVRQYQKEGVVAMVGDGINDAPAIAAADIGIAIGSGSDIAIDSSDVVLMNSRLTDLVKAIRISRDTLHIIYQNLFWAFAYNILLVPLAAGLYTGLRITPMWAAAAMVLSSITVCLNALRLNRRNYKGTKKYDTLLNPVKLGNKIKHKQKNTKKDENKAVVNEEQSIRKKEGKNKTMIKTIRVDGMMCEHCEMTVKKALEKIEGVEKAEPSHTKKEVVLTLSKDVGEDTIRQMILDQGYEYKGIKK